MKGKALFGVCGPVLLLGLFLGCKTDTGTDDADYSAIKVVPVSPKALREPAYDDSRAVSRGANDFAFRLSAALAEQAGAENLVCSPLSVWIPLAALVNAADIQYKAGLLTALGIPELENGDINDGVSRMLYDLTRQREKEYSGEEGYHDPLKIANAIFVDHDVTIKKDFAQTFMDYFRGSSIQVDFESPAAVGEVNKWTSKHTGGMIPEIVQEFAPGTVMALANAIYFFDRWDWEFDPGKTKPDTFYAPGGETTAFYMLREGKELAYYEDEKIQAMPLSFTSWSGMYILLPRDGDAAGLLASLTDDYFSGIQVGSVLAEGKLLLPRFSIEGEVMSFKDVLQTMGIPLFETDSLTGVIQEAPLQLSDALHKAVIKVDERGTTAAAVTVIGGATSAGPQEPEKTFEMNCNKPFVFVLYDHVSVGGVQVLFTGMVNKP
jgi:serpin B